MSIETIDHSTLARLIEAGAVRAAHVVGKTGGWGVIIQYGKAERSLAATRSRQVRLFKRLETVVAYLKDLGISHFDVDTASYDPASVKTYSRPDRAAAMKRAHDAAAHDQWFRDQVQQALAEADDPATVWTPHDAVKDDMRRQREAIRARLAEKAE